MPHCPGVMGFNKYIDVVVAIIRVALAMEDATDNLITRVG
jgi:hypothetical protein